MIPPTDCDVVVIGGGPAGISSAALLAQKGYQVVLLERGTHPREHVGESLIPHFWRYCDHMGVGDRIRAEGFLEKAGGTVVWNGTIQQVSFADFRFDQKALHVERGRFDQILFEFAAEQGAMTFEHTSVQDVALGDDRQVVSWRQRGGESGDIRCRFVVDGSGQAALISKQLGLREVDRDFRFVSIWGYADDAKYVALDGRAYPFSRAREIPPTTFVTALGEDNRSWSWLWHIPLRERTSLGLVVTLDELAEARRVHGSPEAFFHHTCRTAPIVGRLMEDATFTGEVKVIRDFSYRVREPAGPGYFLVGDAATFIDPIFSQGLVLAFYTANLAAWSIDRCIRRPSGTARNQALYTQQLTMRAEMARAMALPGYATGEVSIEGKEAVRFESRVEQKLMQVVAGLTNRSQNYQELVQRADEPPPAEVRTLSEIRF